ncbi:hypothetical protein KPL28_11930 [Clostridium algidicarnis]|uniref:hypothetical protein n=1 Tax=Clostridium algidicarnis TaxID=37659 RepID=UPI001C0AF376|nr:hypothetical protein [Clostridium algidicarnis]MBU3210328.1 hypothetical protein [Clostridium algidicarnis]
MGKRRKRRKYKDVRPGNLGVNQTLEYMNANIIAEKELIILIILKLLSEKLKQENTVLNKKVTKNKEKLYETLSFNIEEVPKNKIVGTEDIESQINDIEEDKNQENILAMEENRDFEEDEIKEGTDFIEDNIDPLEESIYNDLDHSIPIISDTGNHITEDSKYDIEKPKEDGSMDDNKYENIESKITCNSKAIVEKTTLLNCFENEVMKPDFCLEKAAFKVPVVLSEIEVHICVVAVEKFAEPIFKILSLNKRVILKKCQLVMGTNKLFIKGIIEETIEYSTVNRTDESFVKGYVKKVILNIPFKCSTKVSFIEDPRYYKESHLLNIEPLSHESYDINTYEKSHENLGGFDDKVFCHLNSTRILETENKEGIKQLKNTLKGTYTFEKIYKKTILILRLTLLQNQDVFNYNKNKVITP